MSFFGEFLFTFISMGIPILPLLSIMNGLTNIPSSKKSQNIKTVSWCLIVMSFSVLTSALLIGVGLYFFYYAYIGLIAWILLFVYQGHLELKADGTNWFKVWKGIFVKEEESEIFKK